jgi:hypothetical protein
VAPLTDYLIPSQKSEIALARIAAPKSVFGAAEVMVLGRNGYTTAAKGTNGFVCIVEQSPRPSRPRRPILSSAAQETSPQIVPSTAPNFSGKMRLNYRESLY